MGQGAPGEGAGSPARAGVGADSEDEFFGGARYLAGCLFAHALDADVLRGVWRSDQGDAELFGKPRLFHLGYDEETWGHQAKYDYVVVRQGETWWRDFLFFVEQVEKNGSRAWIWSDYYWHHPELFMSRMPKSVLQSNWYYSESFDPEQVAYVQAYLDLDKAGFEQIPTGSNWANATNFQGTVDFCTANLNPELLKGFMQTAWMPTLNASREAHWQAVDQVGAAIRKLATAKA